ncbi:MAG: PIN domain-containing protein [Coriobacteriia bacterium]|nr:PIN domain-containing protein [Coriobacteriia bacterium]
MSAALIDTNVLVYAHDADAPQKQARAIALVRELATTGEGAVCVQVLGEYVNVVARKFRHRLDMSEALDQARALTALFTVHDTTPEVVLEAGRGVERHGFAFYDAQIWAVARLNGISLVYTEEFTHGREVEGVRFENPFRT